MPSTQRPLRSRRRHFVVVCGLLVKNSLSTHPSVASNKKPRSALPAGPGEVVLLLSMVSGADRPARRDRNGGAGNDGASTKTFEGSSVAASPPRSQAARDRRLAVRAAPVGGARGPASLVHLDRVRVPLRAGDVHGVSHRPQLLHHLLSRAVPFDGDGVGEPLVMHPWRIDCIAHAEAE